ncbi:hypothetical protein EGW08_018579 [Elysia chlorotica]|uniref:Transmembrane protein n=1 Tax=Elysia chlorotica TaxID=188477 RepID=A0A433SWH2_ELYCH|nr:hypothetical protein EGW08_018579 [Elysia chlorotica]
MALSRALMFAGFLVIVSLFSGTFAAPARADHPIVSKDTDGDSLLKSKIAQLDSDGQTSDDGADTVGPGPENVHAQEKEMRSLGQEDRDRFKATAQSLKTHHGHRVQAPPDPVLPTEDSIEILAKALARLHLPVTEEEEREEEREGEREEEEEKGSDGERLGTSYNQDIHQEKPEKDAEVGAVMGKSLQQTIAEALARLQGGDQPGRKLQQPVPPSFQNVHEDAILTVESRLLKDLAFANKLGISVDDLIQDLEEQESREENLMKLENSLASLIAEGDSGVPTNLMI